MIAVSSLELYGKLTPHIPPSAEFYLFGSQQPNSADTYMVITTTSAGVTITLSGHF